jgi:biopolymer transport protein ExbD
MPKIKKKRVRIRIDMTPMVDVAFLLLTFFMLTTVFRPADEVEVILPESNSNLKLPETNVMTITVAKKGRVFIGFDSQVMMVQLFGDDFRMKKGVEVQLNRLYDVVTQARISKPNMETVIKSDADAEYGVVSDVMDILQKNSITKFSMVTNLEVPKKKK